MSSFSRVAAVGFSAAALTALLTACSAAETATVEPPSNLVEIEGSDVPQVVLTPEAADAAGVATDTVVAAASTGSSAGAQVTAPLLQMPYSALMYYLDGTTWAYTQVADHTYLRVPVTVADVTGTVVNLSEGPAVGTEVVVTGAPEILGAELEIDGEQ